MITSKTKGKKMNVRKYEKKDIPALMRIWNEVVEAGQAYPQEELLTEQTAEEFFAAQSFTAAAEDNGEAGRAVHSPPEQRRQVRAYRQRKLRGALGYARKACRARACFRLPPQM